MTPDLEGDVPRRPLRRVGVPVARVDRERLAREVVDDGRVAEGVDADSDDRAIGPDVATEDLADADLGRAFGLVLVADHPERDHRVRVVARPSAKLDPAVQRRVQADVGLLLADDGLRVEPVLADAAAERPREAPGLEGGDANLAVQLGAPR